MNYNSNQFLNKVQSSLKKDKFSKTNLLASSNLSKSKNYRKAIHEDEIIIEFKPPLIQNIEQLCNRKP